VYPNGLKRMWAYWANEDPGYVLALIDRLGREGIVDRQRVYVCGISNGAFLTNFMACDQAEKIAAVASVAGTLWKIKADTAKPVRAMPVLYFHGSEDKIVGYDGTDFITRKKNCLSADEFAAWWANRNGCAAKAIVEKLPPAPKDTTTVERHTYKASANAAAVVLYKVTGGGHTWPGGSFQ